MKPECPFLTEALISATALMMTACGGGTVSSGAAASNDMADVAGVYQGTETLTLSRRLDDAVVDRRSSAVKITIDGDGTLRYASGDGSRGEAFITRNHEFRMRADARTHFDGECSAGTLVLAGQLDRNDSVNARYTSDGLVCGGQALSLTGRLMASR